MEAETTESRLTQFERLRSRRRSAYHTLLKIHTNCEAPVQGAFYHQKLCVGIIPWASSSHTRQTPMLLFDSDSILKARQETLIPLVTKCT